MTAAAALAPALGSFAIGMGAFAAIGILMPRGGA
jgi:hypothetical protein